MGRIERHASGANNAARYHIPSIWIYGILGIADTDINKVYLVIIRISASKKQSTKSRDQKDDLLL